MNNSYSSLYPQLNDGANPDDSSSEVPYEKGYQFLYFLENQVMKTPADFQTMLGFYLNKYRGMSITYLEFRLTFNEWIRTNYPAADADAAISKVDWDAWVLAPGDNPVRLDFSTASATEFANMALDYITKKGDASADKYQDYLTTKNQNLKVVFLDQLVSSAASVTPKILAKVDSDLNVTLAPNPELGQRWFPLAI